MTIPDHREVYTVEAIEMLGKAPGTKLAVLGDPISHSLSPRMHMAALEVMNAAGAGLENWQYLRLRVPPELLGLTLPRLHAAGFLGLNLTIPHKTRAVSLIERLDPTARLMGAVNTLRRTSTGYEGFNTDGYGLEQAVREELGQELAGAEIVLLGAGGAARAIAVHCLLAGCAALWIGNRTADRLNELISHLRTLPQRPPQQKLRGFLLHDPRPSDLPEQGILINATSLGLSPDDPAPVPPDFLGNLAVYDSTYAKAPNQLAALCNRRRQPYADGRAMLAWQGARSLELWTSRPVPTKVMRQALQSALPVD